MVNIYLNVDKSTFLFLSIPDSDVQRLSIYPFKWLRFVTFSVCGARGCLSTTPDGPPINYDSASLNGITDLYYTPLGDCIFVDYQGSNDQATSTVPTDCPNDFRDNVIARDGSACVVTRDPALCCDAAHLIPWCKGDQYIQKVFEVRSSCYHRGSLPSISGIDDVRNGVFLTKTVHSMLAYGMVAFLRTPNYGLEPTDIPRIDLGQARTDYLTLQHLEVPENYNPAIATTFEIMANTSPVPPFASFAARLNVDALFQGTGNENGTCEQGTGNLLPPHIILDYMYGAAAYKKWGRQGSNAHDVMVNYHKRHYEDIPVSPRAPGDNNAHTPNPDKPLPASRQRYTSTRKGDTMADAVDDLNFASMRLSGTTPEEVAE
ncbi:hypothetical protein EDB84DRAFT_601098 [Lactarius hengduanensis]|nr:hypothetical protein EDB84DRAFT_601098 [Lactarius hengduanensis]